MPITLSNSSLRWALKHVLREGDTDVFPRPFEFTIIKTNKTTTLAQLAQIEVASHHWEGVRRLMVPKADFAFRPVCQLDPLDAVIYAAIIKEIGLKIERKRQPKSADTVFSYRFEPSISGQLYTPITGWEGFWKTSLDLCKNYSHVLVTDITDFYNQIYHHTIENQLIECGVGRDYITSLKRLLANTTEGVSRGIPIGPHPSHLLAEMSLIPIDEFLRLLGVRFCRYVDDLHIFCESRARAHEVLYEFVEYLDKTQKLQTAKPKTRILTTAKFSQICAANAIDKPISNLERELLLTVRSHTRSPYQRISIRKLSPVDLSQLSQKNIEQVLSDYINASEVDYVRLRWFIRRLTQVGVPGAVEFIVSHFENFLPAIAEVARYFESASENFRGNWENIGNHMVRIYNSGIVQASEYLRVIVLSLFSGIEGIDHIDSLTSMYAASSPMCRRKILLAAAEARASSWLSGQKSAYKNADPWLRRAAIYSMRVLPSDERKFWSRSVKSHVRGLDRLIVDSII